MTNPDLEPGERIAVACPACSPTVETVHEVLKPDGQATVRCTECDHVHKTRIEVEPTVDRDVVVSQEGDSFVESVEVPAEESLAVGEEFVLDTEEAIFVVRITSLELEGDRRAESATGREVSTIWTRVVDNVAVNVTVHPVDGRGDETRSVKLYVPGDYEFTVGESESLGEERFTIEGIVVRRDASGYRREKYDFDGDTVLAKDVKRLYAQDERGDAWSAW